MRPYYAVEILNNGDDYWVEVEITDDLNIANKFYYQWCVDLPHANIRIMRKENLQQKQ
jgi:hypothetical protein